MDLPVIGHVGLQGAVLFLLLLSLTMYGYYIGLNRLLTPLFVTVIALSLSVVPQLHGWAGDKIGLVFAGQARHAAYLAIFCLAFFVLRFVLGRLPRVVELGLGAKTDQLCGLLGGLAMGFTACTMFLVLIYGWRIPLDWLYGNSEIGAFICRVWASIGLLPELHSLIGAVSL